jgi:cysteine desulfurase
VHHFGQQAKAAMDESRSAVAALINADPSEIVFTSGGTEADNFAIRGAAEALEPTGRRHLVASAIEHEAVLNTLKALARRGWRTTLVPVD